VSRRQAGFTIVEVLVAVIILVVGISALAGSSGLVTRMVGQGKRGTAAAEAVATRLEILRQAAAAATPRCSHARFASGDTTAGGITTTWTVPASGATLEVQVRLTWRDPRGTRADTVKTIIGC
jgi:prepilin-type N-terminal cleavage/methylation domain-containing protein